MNEVVRLANKQIQTFFEKYGNKMHVKLMVRYKQYIRDLPVSDVQLLLFYTYNGDEIMNNYLFNGSLPSAERTHDTLTHYENLFTDRTTEFYINLLTLATEPIACIEWCITNLRRILYNAPTFNMDLFVLRGTRTFHAGMTSNVSNRFLSTSILYSTAQGFADNDSNNEERDQTLSCLSGDENNLYMQFLHYIIVSPNTPMIYMPALTVRRDIGPDITFGTITGEREVLFPPGIQITLLSTDTRKDPDSRYNKLIFEEDRYGAKKMCGIIFEKFSPPAAGGRRKHTRKHRRHSRRTIKRLN